MKNLAKLITETDELKDALRNAGTLVVNRPCKKHFDRASKLVQEALFELVDAVQIRSGRKA